MRFTVDISDDKITSLARLAPRFGLDQSQLIQKAVDEMIDKYWVETSVNFAQMEIRKTIDQLINFGKNRTFGPDMTVKAAKEEGRK